MKLSGKQIGQLQEALLDAFPTRNALRMLTRIELDENFDAIAGGENLREAVFSLVSWAEAQDCVPALIQGARRQNDGNARLLQLAQAAAGWFAPAAPGAGDAAAPAQPPDPAAIFLSYSRADRAIMEQLKGDLAAQGLQVWTDAGLKPGTENWMQAIDEAIRQAQCLVVILSPDARQSKWVNIEIARAEQRGLRIFPVLARSAGIDAIPIALTTYQYVDIREAYAQKVSQELIPALRAHLGGAAPVSPAQAAPAKPEPAADPAPAPPAPAQAAPTIVVAQPPAPESPILASLGIEWITIPAGEFRMGSNKQKDKWATDWETPQYILHLPAFRIAKVPLTNAQYRLFVQATGHPMPRHWEEGSIPQGKEQHPVVNVTWDDAQTFCRWAGVRLPTEAEWEKAARGADGRLWPWGNEPPDKSRCNFNRDVGDTTSVGAYPRGASPYGVLDMAGNVWEWTATQWTENYQGYKPDERPAGDARRVVRGGAFYNSQRGVRCAARNVSGPNVVDWYIGFRVVLSPFTSDR